MNKFDKRMKNLKVNKDVCPYCGARAIGTSYGKGERHMGTTISCLSCGKQTKHYRVAWIAELMWELSNFE